MAEEQKVEEVTTVRETPQQVVKTTRVVKDPQVKTEHPQTVYDTKKSIFRTYQVVWYVLGVVETLLIFRLVLKIFGANPFSGFAYLIYSLSSPFALPFNGVLGVSTTPTGSLFEWSTLVAMVVYWIVAYGIIQLLQLVKPTTPKEVEETVDTV